MTTLAINIFLCLLLLTTVAAGEILRPGFYGNTCPKAESIVREEMRKAMLKEARSVASIMRLQFHDCFVNGCDGSVLLDDTPTMLGEKLSLSNIGSLRSFEVVDNIKSALEKACPATVSCADIIIMASREARCFSIVNRLYNQSGSGKADPEFEPIYKEKMFKLCPVGGNENVTSGMDATPKVFDNQYFKDLVSKRGFLNSDQTLFTSPETRGFVQMFSENEQAFFKAFADGMVKMGDLLSTKPGEIRLNCRAVNPKSV
ncbi:unnamed protein product [Cochlearia groenlandica]